ncbi:hypothetical protein [Agrobacterium sp.]|uniref:hypothetical protein n=1 Tax=Agrobacterium sp. TaxID=361 RepID=UPI0028A02988|nr:hypothetical protein [Agrobacterium sp.]
MSVDLHASQSWKQVSQGQIFYPSATIRCEGPAIFRSQFTRDVACLLDVDDAIAEWRCQSLSFRDGTESYRPDFIVKADDSIVVIDAVTDSTPAWIKGVVCQNGYIYRQMRQTDLPSIRLKNVKDLLRYGRFQVSLDDRIRLLAALDEHGTLTVAECLCVVRETRPIAGLASMVLNRFIDIDLDEELIGPESTVRRRRG